MRIIKLNAIDSTNAYLKRKQITGTLEDYTIVIAEHQKEGRGQMGTQWDAEPSKNLTFSIFKHVDFVSYTHQFYISMAVALGVTKALKTLQIPKLAIKWPNDILAERKKIGGILIENSIKQGQLSFSVIGIGLNVNQKFFNNLPKASSLHILTGKLYSIEELMMTILEGIQHYFEIFEAKNYKSIKSEYEALLFRKHKPSTFRTLSEGIFTGYINGISDDGKLEVLVEDQIIKTYDLKEIELQY
ncbi:biotin--[acetyl-CoA-carboxylase] ligase [Winogradskyella maritima]|uniref:Biotin--[acetyl-CoA-carboxylase] ligase n=1 Tax=Winogradskyella maritima TaxID=1517766 RepID=A0ABV8ANC4_9FLAO|nr:biotin--[acetyl-CoA-carboxylase] ligase [Winogradskyella maritima]